MDMLFGDLAFAAIVVGQFAAVVAVSRGRGKAASRKRSTRRVSTARLIWNSGR